MENIWCFSTIFVFKEQYIQLHKVNPNNKEWCSGTDTISPSSVEVGYAKHRLDKISFNLFFISQTVSSWSHHMAHEDMICLLSSLASPKLPSPLLLLLLKSVSNTNSGPMDITWQTTERYRVLITALCIGMPVYIGIRLKMRPNVYMLTCL